jgi:hypothetical protein
LLNPVCPQDRDNHCKFSRPRVDNKGSDSIESTYKRQHKIDGTPRDIVLVDERERPYNPDRDVLRKTEIHGTGIRSPSRKKPVKPGRDDDGN